MVQVYEMNSVYDGEVNIGHDANNKWHEWYLLRKQNTVIVRKEYRRRAFSNLTHDRHTWEAPIDKRFKLQICRKCAGQVKKVKCKTGLRSRRSK